MWQCLLQILAAGMVVSMVCRAVKMDHNTLEVVRWALVAQGGAAFFLAVIPFGKPHWLPWLIALYMASNLFAQAVTARYWRTSQPWQFLKEAQ